MAPPIVTDQVSKYPATSKVGTRLTSPQADLSSNSLATNNRNTSTNKVPTQRTTRHPPVIRTRGHGNRRNLTSIAPLTEESHDKRLHPGGAQQQTKQIRASLHGVLEGRSRRARVSRRV